MSTTRLCTSSATDVTVRGKSLTNDLMGRLTFTEMMFFQVLGSLPTPDQTAVIDAGMVALMEHGLTPTAVVARMTYTSSPDAMQAAVAAGLMGVGSLFVGTMEGCAALLARIVAGEDPVAIVAEHRAARRPVPGFGHPTHRPDDPRAVRLIEIARGRGVTGAHSAALERLARAVDASAGRHVTINLTGAFAAVFADCGVPAEIVRGFALVSRCAGLVGHVHEEQREPTLLAMWEAAEKAVPYAGPRD